MQIDHVCWLVEDPDKTLAELASMGLGALKGMYYKEGGTQHWNVWLSPPQYLEFMSIVNREDAAKGSAGSAILGCEQRGFGLFWWAVLVDNLEEISERLGITINDYTLKQPDGTLRGWRTVTGPEHLPFFIDYPNNGNREERLRAMRDQAGHKRLPTHFSKLVIQGSKKEMDEWLGPNELPLEYTAGTAGIVAAEIATNSGAIVIR